MSGPMGLVLCDGLDLRAFEGSRGVTINLTLTTEIPTMLVSGGPEGSMPVAAIEMTPLGAMELARNLMALAEKGAAKSDERFAAWHKTHCPAVAVEGLAPNAQGPCGSAGVWNATHFGLDGEPLTCHQAWVRRKGK